MFVVSPIYDSQGKVFAALSLRIIPSADFMKILKLGRLGDSGETYLFDKAGYLLSHSRFEQELRRIGLLEENETSIYNVQIKDPGGNMLEGYRPDTSVTKRPLTFMVANALSGKTKKNLEEI